MLQYLSYLGIYYVYDVYFIIMYVDFSFVERERKSLRVECFCK